MSERTPTHVKNNPMAGDVIEIGERVSDELTGEQYVAEFMLRVIAVHEERVWFKEYGVKGHALVSLKKWQERRGSAVRSKMVRGADHDCPF